MLCLARFTAFLGCMQTMSCRLDTPATTFYTPSSPFTNLLIHSGVTVTHFKYLSFLTMEWTTLELSIWQLKVPKSART